MAQGDGVIAHWLIHLLTGLAAGRTALLFFSCEPVQPVERPPFHAVSMSSCLDAYPQERWGNLVDRAWDILLANVPTKDQGATRLVSKAWRQDTGRALQALHLVDPNFNTLQAAHDSFPGLHNLAVTLTQAWDQSVSPRHISSLPLLKELSLHGWLGACVPTPPGSPSQPHLPLTSPAVQQQQQEPPHVPEALLMWAAGSRRMQVLRVTRCALLNPAAIQVFEHLTELHLNNVILPPEPHHHQWGTTTVTAAGAAHEVPGLLMSVLAQLPKLQLLVVHHQERGGWQAQPPPRVSGISSLPALKRLHLTGLPHLLLEAAKQVPGWHQLEEIKLQLVSVNHMHLELHELMSLMQPGAAGLHTFSMSGHSYVSDRDLVDLAQLFPSLSHVSLPLSPLTWDAHWNPRTSHLTPGGPFGSISPAGIQHLVAGRSSPLRALHLPHVPICQEAVRQVCRLPGLKELDLSGCKYVDDSFVYTLTSAPLLEHLGLSGCPGLTDIGLAQLAVCAPHLRHLDVSKCEKPVSDLGVSRLGSLRQLTHLNLAGCSRVTDTGVAGLLCGYPDSPLTHLNLSHCPLLTDKCLHLLADHAPSLTRLVLDNLPAITPAGVHCLAHLSRLTALSVMWCQQAVQEASVQVAYRVLGSRLGPLCSVPPGVLHAVPPAPEPQLPASAITTCSSATSSYDLSEARADHVVPDVRGVQFSWKRYNAGNDMSEGEEGGDMAGSAPGSVLEMRFSPSSSCVGFSPLDDPTPVLASPKWWLNNTA